MNPWPPTRSTQPLAKNFESAIDDLLPAIQFIWRRSFGYELEQWQVDLLRAILELKNGKLRHRQVLISLGRQNGKTEIAAALGLWRLLWRPHALVIGIASTADQARLVYERTMDAVRGNPELVELFSKLTETRGIATNDGGKYEIKAARGAALQGLPIDLGICDEVHLLKMELWTALVNGTGGRDDCLVVGITTAGDDDSALLKHLYDSVDTIGHFIWEAPDSDLANLEQNLVAANPAIASGRIPLANAIEDAKSLPAPDLIRYRFNRFTASQSSFIPMDLWAAAANGFIRVHDLEGPAVISIDRTPDWGYASVTASIKSNQTIYTELVASLTKPTLDDLVELCVQLNKHNPITFVVDSYALRDLGQELKQRGLPVTFATVGDVVNASSMFFAKVQQQALKHASDPLISQQLPGTIRRNVGNGFRISRKDSAVSIDAVISTALGIYFAETLKNPIMQIF